MSFPWAVEQGWKCVSHAECVSVGNKSSRPGVFFKKGVLRNFAKFTGKLLCQSLFFNKVAGVSFLIKTLAEVFSFEFCEISKSTYSQRAPQVAASIKKLHVYIFERFTCSRPANLLRRDSNTSVFLWNLQNCSEHLFWKTSANDCLWKHFLPFFHLK